MKLEKKKMTIDSSILHPTSINAIKFSLCCGFPKKKGKERHYNNNFNTHVMTDLSIFFFNFYI